MKYLNITIEGFESVADRLDFDFSNKPMLLFTGKNGAGKSMLAMWAPIFALYGKVRERTFQEAINTSRGAANVTLTFEMGGQVYRVSRTISKTSPQQVSFDVFNQETEEWEAIGARRSVAETNKDIIDVIGMDYSQAEATFVAKQQEYDAFLKSTPAVRRQLLQRIFQLQGYDDLRAAADMRVKSLASEEKSILAEIEQNRKLRSLLTEGESDFSEMGEEELEEELVLLQESEEERQKQEWESESKRGQARELLRQAREDIENFEKSKAEQERVALDAIRYARGALRSQEIERLQSQLEGVEVALIRFGEIDGEIAEVAQALSKGRVLLENLLDRQEELREEGEKASAELAGHTSTLQALQKQVKLLKENNGTRCNTCFQELTPEMAKNLFKENSVLQEKASHLEGDAKKKVQALRYEYGQVTQRINSGQGYISAQESKQSALQVEKQNLSGVIASKDSLAHALTEAQQAHNEALREVEEQEETLQRVRGLVLPEALVRAEKDAQEFVEKVEAGLPTTDFGGSGRTRISLIERELARRVTVAEKEARFDIEHERLLLDCEAVQEDLEHHRILLGEFSPTGLPALIMAGLVQELEDEINVHLARFSGGKFSVNLETQRERRDGGVDEKIDISINAPDGTRSHSTLSGGESFRVNLAIHLAMCEVSSRRKGLASIQTFVVDEGFGALDPEGVQQALRSLKEVSEDINIVAISHIDAVKDGFEEVVEVFNEGGSSEVRVLS